MKLSLSRYSALRLYSAVIGFGERTMTVLARRLTILTLIMTIFAFIFSALVTAPARNDLRVHLGTAAPCYHPATPNCVAAL
jgi:hypothetical protein